MSDHLYRSSRATFLPTSSCCENTMGCGTSRNTLPSELEALPRLVGPQVVTSRMSTLASKPLVVRVDYSTRRLPSGYVLCPEYADFNLSNERSRPFQARNGLTAYTRTSDTAAFKSCHGRLVPFSGAECPGVDTESSGLVYSMTVGNLLNAVQVKYGDLVISQKSEWLPPVYNKVARPIAAVTAINNVCADESHAWRMLLNGIECELAEVALNDVFSGDVIELVFVARSSLRRPRTFACPRLPHMSDSSCYPSAGTSSPAGSRTCEFPTNRSMMSDDVVLDCDTTSRVCFGADATVRAVPRAPTTISPTDTPSPYLDIASLFDEANMLVNQTHFALCDSELASTPSPTPALSGPYSSM